MKIASALSRGRYGAAVLLLVLAGCATGQNRGVTNPGQPGPAAGRVTGEVVGSVTGNVVGAVAGAGEGFSHGVRASFDNDQRIVRYWHEEKTTDGRTILVPENYLVDQNGRIIRKVE